MTVIEYFLVGTHSPITLKTDPRASSQQVMTVLKSQLWSQLWRFPSVDWPDSSMVKAVALDVVVSGPIPHCPDVFCTDSLVSQLNRSRHSRVVYTSIHPVSTALLLIHCYFSFLVLPLRVTKQILPDTFGSRKDLSNTLVEHFSILYSLFSP